MSLSSPSGTCLSAKRLCGLVCQKPCSKSSCKDPALRQSLLEIVWAKLPDAGQAFRRPAVPIQLATSTYTAFNSSRENIFISFDLISNSVSVGFKLRYENTHFVESSPK
jgi:hypothetical protein